MHRILTEAQIQPQKVRYYYYLERRDSQSETKMKAVLLAYRQAMLAPAAGVKAEDGRANRVFRSHQDLKTFPIVAAAASRTAGALSGRSVRRTWRDSVVAQTMGWKADRRTQSRGSCERPLSRNS